MLRNIVLALLLANILVFTWNRWVVPPDAEYPDRLGDVSEPQLVLLSDGSSPEVVVASDPGSEDGDRCRRIGPFADIGVADSVAQQLSRIDFKVRRTSKAGEVWVGYWVQLIDLKTLDKARQALNRLTKAGLVDAYIFQTEPTINVSLGLFRERRGADRVASLAQDLGLNPETTDRFQPGIEHWLTVELEAAQTLELSEIEFTTAQIMRTENVLCDSASVVDARIQP
jgi:hypothetical protein